MLAGPASPIRKSRFPSLNVGERGGQSPWSLAGMRLSSPLGLRDGSPRAQSHLRGMSSLAMIRHAAKAGAGAADTASAGPHFSGQALRLPSPFQMAPSLAAKRERMRSRWPVATGREAGQGATGREAGQGGLDESPPRAPPVRAGSRSFEEVLTNSHEILIVHENIEPRLTAGYRPPVVRPYRPPPAATLDRQPSMSSLDSLSTMSDAQPPPLWRQASMLSVCEVAAAAARGSVSEPVSRRPSPPRAGSLVKAVSSSRIPRPRLVGPGMARAQQPIPALPTGRSLPASGVARRRSRGEPVPALPSAAPPPLAEDPSRELGRRDGCGRRNNSDVSRWPVPKLGEPMAHDGPVYRGGSRPSRASSRAASPLRVVTSAAAASPAPSPLREVASLSTQTTQTSPHYPRFTPPLAPLPSRVASPASQAETDSMEVSLPPSAFALASSTAAPSAESLGRPPAAPSKPPSKPPAKLPSPVRPTFESAPRPLAQRRMRPTTPKTRSERSAGTGDGAVPAPTEATEATKLSDDAASMLELLRVDIEQAGALEAAESSVRAGAALLEHLRSCARGLVPPDDPWAPREGAVLCRIWQQLRSGARPGSATGGPRLARTPANGAAAPVDLLVLGDASAVAALAEAADALCRLLRLSLCDAADLELAASVLADATLFFQSLRARADVGADPLDTWRQLAAV